MRRAGEKRREKGTGEPLTVRCRMETGLEVVREGEGRARRAWRTLASCWSGEARVACRAGDRRHWVLGSVLWPVGKGATGRAFWSTMYLAKSGLMDIWRVLGGDAMAGQLWFSGLFLRRSGGH